MPSYSFKIAGDHPILQRVDQTVFAYSEMVGWVRTLRRNGYDNIKAVQTDLTTLNQIPLSVKDIGLGL